MDPCSSNLCCSRASSLGVYVKSCGIYTKMVTVSAVGIFDDLGFPLCLLSFCCCCSCCSRGKSSGGYGLCGCSELHIWKGPMLAIVLCGHCCEILNDSWTRHPALRFCSRPTGLMAGLARSAPPLLSSPSGVWCCAVTPQWELDTLIFHPPGRSEKEDFHFYPPSSAGLLSLSPEVGWEPQRTEHSSSPVEFSFTPSGACIPF